MGPEDHQLRSIDTLRDDILASTAASPQHVLRNKGWREGVRYRYRTACLVAFYVSLLILPWIFTSITMFRPIHFPSYNDNQGNITLRDMSIWENWQTATRVLRTTAVTIGLPIVSALLAQGAIVYTQRSRPGQHLNALQMFTLADKTWMSPLRLWNVGRSEPRHAASQYLWLAAGLIAITAIQPPLQSILIEDESKVVMTCTGHPSWSSRYGDKSWEGCYKSDGIQGNIVGYDAELAYLASCPQGLVVQTTLERLISASKYDTQMYLWLETGSDLQAYGSDEFYGRNNFDSVYRYWTLNEGDNPYFASSITSGSTTGIYRQHAARMDSRVNCTNVEASNFPKNCRGKMPLQVSFSHPDTEIDICVEGDSEEMPWKGNRDKQEHSERLWLRFNSTTPYQDHNYTLKCESNSRRGWFELPNRHNNYVVGPLLDVWPSQEELARDFNDYNHPYDSHDPYPHRDTQTKWPDDGSWTVPDLPATWLSPNGTYLPTPGPLMTAALAMFGNTSVFHAAAKAERAQYNETVRQICQEGNLPLSRFNLEDQTGLCYTYDPDRDDNVDLEILMAKYFGQFLDANTTREGLEVAMFFANEALLTVAATDTDNYRGRAIRTSPGRMITKPKKSMPGLVIISFLILLQVVGLGVLVAFIYSFPTWTNHLDADALAQIGVQINDLGEPRPPLQHVCGLVGVIEPEHGDDDSSLRTAVVESVKLGLGGKGIISSETMKAMRPEPTRRPAHST